MNNISNLTTDTHIYKLKGRTLVLNALSVAFLFIVMGIPFVLFIMMLVSIIRADANLGTFKIFFVCTLSPLVVLMGFNLMQTTINFILSFFSYIKVSPEGIEQKQSPYKHIRCDWSEVDRLGKFFLYTEVIYLSSYKVIGLSTSLIFPFKFFQPKQGFISLSGFDGWPDGQLRNDLKQYFPKLFENQPILGAVHPENQDALNKATPGASQDRLLAALSHAAIILSLTGVIVPIGIYVAQNRKSSYLGFQALQALSWQIAAFMFSSLASSCLVGAVFIPVLSATLSNNEQLIESLGGGIVILVAASVLFLIFGNLAFIIYGVVGAIMTYQGKDFRYLIIGNWVKKSKDSSSAGRV